MMALILTLLTLISGLQLAKSATAFTASPTVHAKFLKCIVLCNVMSPYPASRELEVHFLQSS